MKTIETKIPGVLIIEADVFSDYRGYFTETYNKPKYESIGITTECDNVYNKSAEGGMRYDAPEIAVSWDELLNGIEPILSEKDMVGPILSESNNQFIYGQNC